MTKIANHFQSQPPISETIQELIQACNYNLFTLPDGTLHFQSHCGTRRIKCSPGCIVYQQQFDQETDRLAEWRTLFTAAIQFAMPDHDLSLLLQLIGAIDISNCREFKDYKRLCMPGGNAGYFGIRKAMVA